MRISNLHLIQWENIILDFSDVTNIRTDTAKGAAAKKLSGRNKLSLVLAADSSESTYEKSSVSHEDRVEDSTKLNHENKNENDDSEEGLNSIDSYTDNYIEIESVSAISNIVQSEGKTKKIKTITLGQKKKEELQTKKLSMRKISDDGDITSRICENARNVLQIPVGSRDRDVLYDIRKETVTENERISPKMDDNF